MATQYGKTWWGRQWLGALKNIDYSNRLPRGASYARNGRVKQIAFVGNVIHAKVQGSLHTPYRETIKLPQFAEKDIEKLMDLIGSHPIVLSKLLNRQLDESVAHMAEQAGLHLFPRQWSDLQMNCSCPDWAVPCKHLAAVIYKTSMEIDNNPFLVFSLHGVDLLHELEKRGITPGTTKIVEVDGIETVYDAPFALNTEAATDVPDYTLLPGLALPLSNLLPASPAFCHDSDFRTAYQHELLYVVKTADRILAGKLQLVEAAQEPLGRHDECGTDDFCPGFYQRLLNLPTDRLPDYPYTIIAARQMVVCALQLIAHGCIVPQIFHNASATAQRGRSKKETNRLYLIIWQPAMMDEATHYLVSHLGQQAGLLSKIITDLVHLLAHAAQKNVFGNLFFTGMEYGFSGIGETNIPGGIRSWLDRYFIQVRHQVTFHVSETDKGFRVHITVDGNTLKDIMTLPQLAGQRMEILQQLALLTDIVDGLDRYINDLGAHSMNYTLQAFTSFLLEMIPAMRLLGVQVVIPKALQQLVRPRISIRLQTKESDPGKKTYLSMMDLLSFDWRIAVGDELLTPADFASFIGHAEGLLRFKGQYVYADAETMVRLNKALSAPPKIKPSDLLQAALSGEYLGTPIELTDELREMIRQFTSVDQIPLPQTLNARLRPYQERGYSWMYRNLKLGFGCIIADDMGLGKTLQVITLLLKLKEEGELKKKKALVVVPTGLLNNWQLEVARFAPQLTTALYHGPSRNLKETTCKSADLLITTYGVARSDADQLKKRKWQVLVIDEAQNIKNSGTAQSKAIHSIPAEAHIAMSGTPVENRLSEFWSIIDFTNKGYLGSQKDFAEHYARPIQNNGDKQVADRFKKVTAPFLMRRLKTDKSIISDLPDKITQNQYATLTPEQAALYQETVTRCMAVIENMEADDSQALFKRQGLILQMILALKQICNHPTQYLKDNRMDASLSGKSQMLLDRLRAIVDAQEKVIVFTQFREMGDLLVRFIREELDEIPLFYHGGCSLKQRQAMVDRFQNDRNCHIFLLSLKAAGTGLNLTAATNVIHYDLWWNPAVEAQATDRAYRIGQHQNVQVFRFITQNTFEERIDAMIQDKRHLAEMTVATGESWIGKLSNRELHDIFG